MSTLNVLVFMASFVFFTVCAYANEDQPEVISIKKNAVYEGSSEHNRMGKSFSIAYHAGGGPSGVLQSGVVGSYFLSRNSLIEVRYGSGSLTSRMGYSYSSVTGTRRSSTENRVQTGGVYYKNFQGNSVYYKLGAEHTSLTSTRLDEMDPATQYDYQGGNLMAAVVIGNQWQFDNFTLGCDWIGYSLPVMSWKNRESVAINDARRYREDEIQNHLTSGTIQFLRFYLGASF